MEKFKALLDEQYNWPATYMYKFIMPKSEVSSFKALFNSDQIFKETPSKKGNYISVTLDIKMFSSSEVISIYKKVSILKGVISL